MFVKFIVSLFFILAMVVPTNLRADDASEEDYNSVEDFLEQHPSQVEDQNNFRPRPRPYPHYRAVCVAVDRGWEEHRNGHVGYGWTTRDAAFAAMGNCRQFHGTCRISSCR